VELLVILINSEKTRYILLVERIEGVGSKPSQDDDRTTKSG
jgi:hypothetical protein